MWVISSVLCGRSPLAHLALARPPPPSPAAAPSCHCGRGPIGVDASIIRSIRKPNLSSAPRQTGNVGGSSPSYLVLSALLHAPANGIDCHPLPRLDYSRAACWWHRPFPRHLLPVGARGRKADDMLPSIVL